MLKIKCHHRILLVSCGITQDMAPTQPQRTGGCMASSHKDKENSLYLDVIALSRLLCLSQSVEFSHATDAPSSLTL